MKVDDALLLFRSLHVIKPPMQESAFWKESNDERPYPLRRIALCLLLLPLSIALLALVRQDPDEILKRNLKDKGLVGEWVYDDIAEGYALAKKSGKPLMVVFRCVP